MANIWLKYSWRTDKTKYSYHLNTGQVWYSNGPNMSCHHLVWFFEWLSKNRTKMSVSWSKMSKIWVVHLITWSDHLKIVQKVECFNFGCWIFTWLLYIRQWGSEKQLLLACYSDIWYSDHNLSIGIQMVVWILD